MKLVWGRSIGFNMSLNGMDKLKPSGWKPMESTIITNGANCYPWTETFVMWPKTTITGKKLFWVKAFKRGVWVVWGTGFHMEPKVQYATLFEILETE